MKKILFRFVALCLPVLGALAGCAKEPATMEGPSASLSLVNVGSVSAELNFHATSVTEFAWLLYTSEDEAVSDANVLFATGSVSSCVSGDNLFTVSGLVPNSSYGVVLAAKTENGTFMDEIFNVSFTTSDLEGDIAVLDRTDDGFSIYVKVPQSVKDNGNVIRYAAANIVMYNSNKQGWFSSLDADMLEANGQKFFVNDTTITYNDENIYSYDEDGNILVDEWGQEIYNHDPFVPGEPLVFLAGEFGRGESNYGWGEGWYKPMFDYDLYFSGQPETECWTGYYSQTYVSTLEPETLDSGVDIEVNAKATSGTVKLTPDEGVEQYCVLIMDNATYQGSVLPLLNNNEDYLQWFTTSYYAAVLTGALTFYEPAEIVLEEYYYMQPEVEYHVLVTAMGDSEGLTQSFQHETFTTPAKSMDPPVVEVKHIANPSGEESPFEIWFNVKAPDSDLKSAMYAANYEREWASVLNQGLLYSDVVSSGNSFTSAEVAQINSEYGLDLCFSSMDDAVTILAVMGYNEEDTPNDIDAEGSPAIAEGRTIPQPDAERVESGLFDDLVGEWTATATVASYDYNAGGYVEQGDMSTKVVISAGVSYPETLTDDVYAIYEAIGMDKAETDALYEEFKTEAEEFNAKVRGQNRLLCLGFGYETTSPTAFASASPFDLFSATEDEYNGYDIASLFYDFGPKWYLQVADGDVVSVPVNSTRLTPLTAWTDNAYYLVGVSETSYISVGENDENAYFPVEVSSDGNTVTFKAMTYSDSQMYPNAGYFYYGYFYYPGTAYRIVSDIRLTRGWTGESASPASVPGPVNNQKSGLESWNGASFRQVCRPKSKTPFGNLVKYEQKTYAPVSQAQFEENARQFFSKKAEQSRSVK